MTSAKCETSGSPATGSSGPTPPAPEHPVARLYGAPLAALPQDLYIPPDALEVFLESFEGPLDLLLYLIRKQNFNILDIPMAVLTRQYLAYVEEIRRHNLELAADYLVMAATLIQIKSRLLLPEPPAQDDGEAEDPRAELARRLLEYERVKLGAERLEALPRAGRDFWHAHAAAALEHVPALPNVAPADLLAAWSAILARARRRRAHVVPRASYSVHDSIRAVLAILDTREEVPFVELFAVELGPPMLVVTLMAVLELTRAHRVAVDQATAYAPIVVRRRDAAIAA